MPCSLRVSPPVKSYYVRTDCTDCDIVFLKELEALRGGEAARLRELSAEQRELRCELEAVHSEQARQLSQAQQEQLDLESRLEQLRQQACACEPGAQRQQEAHYTAQVQALTVNMQGLCTRNILTAS